MGDIMNKEEFLIKIFNLYPNTVSKQNGNEWLQVYKENLKDTIDYDALFDFIVKNYSGVTAPKPAYLLANATYKKEFNQNKYVSFPTILADKNGSTYEFGQEGSFAESEYYLKKRGFENIRLK